MKPFVALLLCASVCYAQILGSFSDLPFFSSQAVAASYLIKQGFEGTGYDNGETWDEVIAGSSVVDEDYTSTVLDGSQSCRISHVAASGETSSQFTTTDEVWGYFLLRPVTISGIDNVPIMLMRLDGANVLFLKITPGGNFGVAAAGSYVNTVGTVSAGTTYHVWVRYKKGTGSDAIGEVAFSTDGIKPTSGNNFASSTGPAVTGANKIVLGNTGGGTWENIYDKVRVDDVEIGDNPP